MGKTQNEEKTKKELYYWIKDRYSKSRIQNIK